MTFMFIYWHNSTALTILLGLLGAAVIPTGSVCFAFAVELTYPISEAVSNGMMVMVSRVIGTGIGFLA